MSLAVYRNNAALMLIKTFIGHDRNHISNSNFNQLWLVWARQKALRNRYSAFESALLLQIILKIQLLKEAAVKLLAVTYIMFSLFEFSYFSYLWLSVVWLQENMKLTLSDCINCLPFKGTVYLCRQLQIYFCSVWEL